MNPAQEIPLSREELAQLGTVVAIFGQFEDIMVQTVTHLLKVDRQAGNVIMGSTNIRANASIWSEVIRNRTRDEDVLWLTEIVEKEIDDIQGIRNDFLHAVFFNLVTILANGTTLIGRGGGGLAIGPPPHARRFKSKKNSRPVTDLPQLIERAARVSCLVAHLDHIISGNQATTSPWLQRLAPTLPPRLDTAETRKAQERPDQRRSSRRKRQSRYS